MTGMALLLVFVVAADDGGWNSSTGRAQTPVRSAADSFGNSAREGLSGRNTVSALPSASSVGGSLPANRFGASSAPSNFDNSVRMAATGSWRDLEDVLSQPASSTRSSATRADDLRSFGAAGKLRVNLEPDPLPSPPQTVGAGGRGTARGVSRGTEVPLERGRVRSWLDEDPSAWEIPAVDDRLPRSSARRSVARVEDDATDWSDPAWDNRQEDPSLSRPRSSNRSRNSSTASRETLDDLVDDPLSTPRNSRWRNTTSSDPRVSDSRTGDSRTGSRWSDSQDFDEEPLDEPLARDRSSRSRSPNVGVFLPREYQERETSSATRGYEPRGYEDRWADDRFRDRDYVSAPPRDERIDADSVRPRTSSNADPFNVGPIPASEEPGSGDLAGTGGSGPSGWPFEPSPSHTSRRTPIDDPAIDRTGSSDFPIESRDIDSRASRGNESSAARSLSERPWWPFLLSLIGLFASMGFNVYLGWIAWDLYTRYQDAVDDVQELEQRMEKQQAALDAGPMVSSRPSRSTAIVG